jgi:3-oxoadipate enol-lactonase
VWMPGLPSIRRCREAVTPRSNRRLFNKGNLYSRAHKSKEHSYDPATIVIPTRDMTIERVSACFRPRLYDHQRVLEGAGRGIFKGLSHHPDQPARPWRFASPTPRGYRIEDFVEDVNRVFRALSIERAILIGLGGIVAQEFAIKYGNFLKALILVDTTSHGVDPEATADAFLAMTDKRGFEKAVLNLSDISFSSSASPALLEWTRREVIQTPEFVARKAVRSLNDACTRASLSQIKMPTLVIAGEEDRVTPPQESDILAKGISDSTLSFIPGAGHFSMLENPVACRLRHMHRESLL